MKSTLKIAALVLAFAGLSYSAKAQTTPTTTSTTTKSGVRYSIGVETGIPTGNFNDTHGWNIGGSVQADIPVAQQVFVTVNAGYNNFFGKKVDGLDFNNIQLLPVKAGVKFFPVQNFYIQGEAGAAFLLNKSDTNADKTTAFVWAPTIGVQFPISANGNFIDAGVRYESTSNYSSGVDSKLPHLGLRLAYGF